MGFFKQYDEDFETAQELIQKACSDCRKRNGGCTDAHCGIGLVQNMMPEFGSEWILGKVNSKELDTFWCVYQMGHMTAVFGGQR